MAAIPPEVILQYNAITIPYNGVITAIYNLVESIKRHVPNCKVSFVKKVTSEYWKNPELNVEEYIRVNFPMLEGTAEYFREYMQTIEEIKENHPVVRPFIRFGPIQRNFGAALRSGASRPMGK